MLFSLHVVARAASWPALFLAAATALSTFAVAAPTVHPTVVPGPGLPTLAELGITSEELYARPPSLQARAALYSPVCQTYSTGDVDDVIACFNYLEAIGGNACTVDGDNVQFCYAGDAQVTGSNESGYPSASSLCSDVALGLQWIFTYCNQGGRVGGSQAANGNGGLIVGVENIIW
ncbi:hypothetical protein BV25DRAFT_1918544 [Artomyces pyxidatus]|uniref:Uncharacterized protein n=1 Tax=Artomyces pyxidatus TaxID=48021 RepID=A0ACB8SSV2_9AGAM|nr:hypothetical protein BV25DRAFT_1918544 [Artomyces pyxidatus]